MGTSAGAGAGAGTGARGLAKDEAAAAEAGQQDALVGARAIALTSAAMASIRALSSRS